MKKELRLPITLMLTAVGGFIIFALLAANSETGHSLRLTATVLPGLAISGIMLASALVCRRACGPREGHLFRSFLLICMSVYAVFNFGIATAVILAATAAVIGSFYFQSTAKTPGGEALGGDVLKSIKPIQ